MKYTIPQLLQFRESPLSNKRLDDLPRIQYVTIPGPVNFDKPTLNKPPQKFRNRNNKFKNGSGKFNKGRKHRFDPKSVYKPNNLVKERSYSGIVKSHINKISVDNFDKLIEQIAKVLIWCNDSELKEILETLIDKIKFEKHFSGVYARLVRELSLKSSYPFVNSQFVNNEMYKTFENSFDIAFENFLKQHVNRTTDNEILRKQDQSVGCFIAELDNSGIVGESEVIAYSGRFFEFKRVESLCNLLLSLNKNKKRSDVVLSTLVSHCTELVDSKEITKKQKFMIQDILELEQNNWHKTKIAHNVLKPISKEKPKTRLQKPMLEMSKLNTITRSCIEEYLSLSEKQGNEEITFQFQDFEKYHNNNEIKYHFIKQTIDFSLEKNKTTQQRIVQLFKFMTSNSLVSKNVISSVLNDFYEIVDDLILDIPKIKSILDSFTF